jgi:hypothetical protein
MASVSQCAAMRRCCSRPARLSRFSRRLSAHSTLTRRGSLRLVQFDEGQGGNSESTELAYEVLAAASAVVDGESSAVDEGLGSCRKADAEFVQRVMRPVSGIAFTLRVWGSARRAANGPSYRRCAHMQLYTTANHWQLGRGRGE